MSKKIKAYAVKWKDSVKDDYLITASDNEIVIAETEDGADQRKFKYLVIDYPLFAKKKDAELFRAKNKDWEIIEVNITY